ncbi:hypothetical protein [Streptomyces nigra]|uniref:hypothetical protein n=1 Tax=Streptomyces nigra TaxID=1827580 RepID=UPI0034440D37
MAALALLSGCASGDDQPASSSSSASADGARAAVVAYVDALNSRSVARLIDVGGVEDEFTQQPAESGMESSSTDRPGT